MGPTPGTAWRRRISTRRACEVCQEVVHRPDLLAGLSPYGIVQAHMALQIGDAGEGGEEALPTGRTPQHRARAGPAARPAEQPFGGVDFRGLDPHKVPAPGQGRSEAADRRPRDMDDRAIE